MFPPLPLALAPSLSFSLPPILPRSLSVSRCLLSLALSCAASLSPRPLSVTLPFAHAHTQSISLSPALARPASGRGKRPSCGPPPSACYAGPFFAAFSAAFSALSASFSNLFASAPSLSASLFPFVSCTSSVSSCLALALSLRSCFLDFAVSSASSFATSALYPESAKQWRHIHVLLLCSTRIMAGIAHQVVVQVHTFHRHRKDQELSS